MRLGLCLPQAGPHVTGHAIREFAIEADRLGFDTLWVQDHLFFPHTPVDQPAGAPEWPESYRSVMAPLELLAHVAAITQRIKLGTSVLVSAYHRPVALAKQMATLDVLSGGRMLLGLGLGWSRDEYALSETPYEKRGERGTDFLRALRACWDANPVEYNGPVFRIPKSDTSPKPIQRDKDGRPAIPIAGAYMAEAGYARVAELCDYWHPATLPLDQVLPAKATIDTMAREKFDRGPLGLIIRAFASPKLPGLDHVSPPPLNPAWTGRPENMLPQLRAMKDAGVTEIVLDTNYFRENPGESGWISQPSFFLPLLEESHRGR